MAAPAAVEENRSVKLMRSAHGILSHDHESDAPAAAGALPDVADVKGGAKPQLTARQRQFKLANRRGSLLQMGGKMELGARAKGRENRVSALDFLGEIVSAAAVDERVRMMHNVKRNLDRPGNMGYVEAPRDPVWSTSPFDVVGGWADAEQLHTEPGKEPGWARVPLDSEGIPVREWRTATRGAVVSLGTNLDKTTGIDALEMLYTPERPQSPVQSFRESSFGAILSATDLRMQSAEALEGVGVMWSPEVGLTTSEAVRLEARTFSPWKPLKVTLPEEPEPEPEPLVDSIYRMRRFRPAITKSVQNSIYVSVTGKDSADGSRYHPVQVSTQAIRQLLVIPRTFLTARL